MNGGIASMPDAPPSYIMASRPPDTPLTARNLEDFAQCPHRFLLSFFSGRKQRRQSIGGPAALHSAVRAALLGLYGGGGSEHVGLDSLLDAYEEAWDGSLCRDSREEEDLHKQGREMLRRHWDNPVPASGPIQTDVRMSDEIQGHRLVAVADLVIAEPSAVVRFTTSRRPPSPGELQSNLSWGVLYLMALRSLATPEAPSADMACLMVDLRKTRAVAVQMSEEERGSLEARTVGLARDIRREREFPPVTGQHCRWCRSREDCTARKKS